VAVHADVTQRRPGRSADDDIDFLYLEVTRSPAATGHALVRSRSRASRRRTARPATSRANLPPAARVHIPIARWASAAVLARPLHSCTHRSRKCEPTDASHVITGQGNPRQGNKQRAGRWHAATCRRPSSHSTGLRCGPRLRQVYARPACRWSRPCHLQRWSSCARSTSSAAAPNGFPESNCWTSGPPSLQLQQKPSSCATPRSSI